MKRLISIACAVFIVLSMSVPVLAEDKGKPVLDDWLYFEETKDEAYWDWRFDIEKEQPEIEYAPGYEPPTQEQIEAQEQREREQNEAVWEDSIRYEKDQRVAIMNLVFGDDKCFEAVEAPPENFEGEYKEFKNDDGSETRIYDTGSILTKYTDGSFEGFDLWGNRYVMDNNGDQTIQFTDGNSMTCSNDSDTYVWHGNDGSTITTNENGNIVWNKSGIVIEYDSELERSAIGFEHGEMMELRDGMFPQGDGKFEGPDGAVIEWHNGSVHCGDHGYSFRVIGEDGRSGQVKNDPNYNNRVDVEATRAKKLETNGAFKDVIMTSDTKTEISTLDGNAWGLLINNDDRDTHSVTFENWDGDVYREQYFSNGNFSKSYVNGDGTEKYNITLDDYGLHSSYTDKEGEHVLIQTECDEEGNVTISFESGLKYVINDEIGYYQYTDPDGSYISIMEGGGIKHVEYCDPVNGVNYVEENDVVISGTLRIADGITLKINRDDMSIVTQDGEVIEVEEHPDGSYSATLPDGTVYTKQPEGEWMKDNLPLDDSPDDISGKPDALPPERNEEDEEEDTEDDDGWTPDNDSDDDYEEYNEYDDSDDWTGPNYEQNTNDYIPDNDLETADTGYRYYYD